MGYTTFGVECASEQLVTRPYQGSHESNIGVRVGLRYCGGIFLWGGRMELAIVTIAILIAASQIPGDYHVVFFR
jgi:hypothetical protein